MLPTITQALVPTAYIFPNVAQQYQRKWLVLHKTAGGSSAREVAQFFQDGAPQSNGTLAYTSVHYVVGLDGAIVQCVLEQDGAGGNCCLEVGHDPFWPTNLNLNLVTFSIESVDPALDNSTPMPLAQQQALFPLVKDICTRNAIPMRPADANGGIAGHSSLEPQTRAECPGNFPWGALWIYLQHGGTMITLPAGWHDDGTTLLPLAAPDGKQYPVTQGNRQYILDHVATWDPINVAIEQEHGIGVGVTWQTFRKSALTWTPQTGVAPADLGVHYLAAQLQVTTLQSQAAAANAPFLLAISNDLKVIAASTADAEAALAKL